MWSVGGRPVLILGSQYCIRPASRHCCRPGPSEAACREPAGVYRPDDADWLGRVGNKHIAYRSVRRAGGLAGLRSLAASKVLHARRPLQVLSARILQSPEFDRAVPHALTCLFPMHCPLPSQRFFSSQHFVRYTLCTESVWLYSAFLRNRLMTKLRSWMHSTPDYSTYPWYHTYMLITSSLIESLA